ncbi:glycerol-3-phosphate responsive antiterminator [Ferrimicrobium sp.]|uniref:glycerol-3-phosphate responsive antiterminator n=1 Tax=Ferrimicrobium sp. TaxID=2926050 RepID=UPI0026352DC9|nr:glycerol-3-phosphate responsive antiterminator [Ferrimicrobium sp.]
MTPQRETIRADEIPKIIFAAREPADVLAMLAGMEPSWVFLLGGSASEVLGASKLLSDRGFSVFVHVDMLRGISNDSEGMRLLASFGHPKGIITTHPSAVNAAKKLGLLAIERIFLLDSLSVESGLRNVLRTKPDAVEVLPGVLPEQITKVADSIDVPLIAGGLITHLDQVTAALKAGARGVSTSSGSLVAGAEELR